MNPHRAPGPLAKLPPRAPWWRLLRAFLDGTLRRVAGRRKVLIVTDMGAGWVRADAWDVFHGRAPKGPVPLPRPANVSE